jgi:hypothetical protein
LSHQSSCLNHQHFVEPVQQVEAMDRRDDACVAERCEEIVEHSRFGVWVEMRCRLVEKNQSAALGGKQTAGEGYSCALAA